MEFVYLNRSKHRKETVKIWYKRQKMAHLCRALDIDGAYRFGSCSMWSGSECEGLGLLHTTGDFTNTTCHHHHKHMSNVLGQDVTMAMMPQATWIFYFSSITILWPPSCMQPIVD